MPDGSTKLHGMPNWADCGTTDLDAAEAFYSAVFGWTPERVTASDGAVYSLQRLDGKMVAGLYALDEELRKMGVPPHWGTYVEVDDVPETLKKVEAAGGKVLEGPSSEPEVGTFAVIQDNVDAFLRLWTSAPEHGGEIFNVPGAMTWNELATKEPEKAAEFYRTVLGVETEHSPGPPDYTVLKIGERPVAGILKMTPEMGDMPATWDVYFYSDDVDATVAAVVEAGGEVIRPAFDVAQGMGRMAVLADPMGAVFEVIKMSEGAG